MASPEGWPKVAWVTLRFRSATGCIWSSEPQGSPEGALQTLALARSFPAEQAAPLSAVPVEASGTFNPLCKVLCILQSLYLCSIGLLPGIITCEGYTSHFKLQSQATLLRDPSSHVWMTKHTPAHRTVTCCSGSIPDHFLVPSQEQPQPLSPLPTASENLLIAIQGSLSRQVLLNHCASSLAVTEAIAVACISTTK